MAFIDNFRTARWFRTANLLLQALLFTTLFGGLNYLAGSLAWRWELPHYRRDTLAPETVAYLTGLPNPVEITVTTAEDQASPEVRGLLREFLYATEGNGERRIAVNYLDVDRQRREALSLGIDQPNEVFVRCGARHSVLGIPELYRMQDGRRVFQGEQLITAAVLDVSNPVRKKIYFLVGHGELRPDDSDPERGLSEARDELEQRNFSLDTLDLTQSRQIPADASLLIAVAPQTAYTPFEQELLRRYLDADAGRLILFLAPGAPSGLADLLRDWSVVADDDLLCDTGAKNLTEDGDIIINDLQPHPITQALINYRIPLRIGPTRTVRPDPESAAANGLDTRVLAVSSPTAWGEVSYRDRGAAAYRPGIDLRPTPGAEPDGLGIAVASERVAGRQDLPFSVPRGRLVVFGTGDLIANSRIANAGALDILRGAVNWTVDRNTQLSIPARPIEQFQLSLSAGSLTRLRLCLLFGLPGAVALLGLAVHWTRRT